MLEDFRTNVLKGPWRCNRAMPFNRVCEVESGWEKNPDLDLEITIYDFPIKHLDFTDLVLLLFG